MGIKPEMKCVEFPEKEIFENELDNGVLGLLIVSRTKIEENAADLGGAFVL